MQHVVEAIEKVYEKALAAMKERFVVDGKPSGKKLNMEQLRAHGLAYLATETMACRELAAWAERVGGEGPRLVVNLGPEEHEEGVGGEEEQPGEIHEDVHEDGRADVVVDGAADRPHATADDAGGSIGLAIHAH